MLIRCLLFLFLFSSALDVLAQRRKKVSPIGQGTLYGFVGYNRSAYGLSDFSVAANNYNFTMHDVRFTDNPDGAPISSFFGTEGFSNFQVGAQLGYFIKKNWALGLGFERYNFFIPSDNILRFSGNFAPGSHSIYSGNYESEPIAMVDNYLNYRQSQGVSYIQINALRVDELFANKQGTFQLASIAGLGAGVLVADAIYTFDGFTSTNVVSVSGFGFNTYGGVRLNFWKHVFLQTRFVFGGFNQRNIQLREANPVEGGHFTTFFAPEVSIGFNIFVRPSDCGTCPQW